MVAKISKARRLPARTPEERNAILRLRREARDLAAGLERFEAMAGDYIKATGMSQTRFSYESCGQVDFMRLLRDKRDFRTSTVLRVLKFVGAQTTPDPLA